MAVSAHNFKVFGGRSSRSQVAYSGRCGLHTFLSQSSLLGHSPGVNKHLQVRSDIFIAPGKSEFHKLVL